MSVVFREFELVRESDLGMIIKDEYFYFLEKVVYVSKNYINKFIFDKISL